MAQSRLQIYFWWIYKKVSHFINKVGATETTGGENFTQPSEVRGQSLGETNGNSALEGILKSHLICTPKSSEAGSFYFERPPGKDTQKPLFGGAITVLTALTRWKFNPPNLSPATANASWWSLSIFLRIYIPPCFPNGCEATRWRSGLRVLGKENVKELSAMWYAALTKDQGGLPQVKIPAGLGLIGTSQVAVSRKRDQGAQWGNHLQVPWNSLEKEKSGIKSMLTQLKVWG